MAKETIKKHISRAIIKSLFNSTPSFFKFKQSYRFFINYSENEKKRLKNQTLYNSVIPPVCIFSVTWKCNLSCKGCYALNYNKNDTLNLKEISQIIDSLVNYGTYIFIIAGGEPLTIENIIPELGKNKKAIFFLFTNGTMLDDEKIGQLRKNKNILPLISFEGDNDSTDTRRGNKVGEKVEKLFINLKKAKIPFGISTMATHKNIDFVISKEHLDWVHKSGAVFLYIIDYIPFEFNLKTDFVLTENDHLHKRQELAKRAKDTKLTFYNFPSDEYSDGFCESAGKGFIHINAHGYVEPCPFSHYAKDNILEKDFIEILNSNFMNTIRNDFASIKNETGDCLLVKHSGIVKEIVKKTDAFCTEAKCFEE